MGIVDHVGGLEHRGGGNARGGQVVGGLDGGAVTGPRSQGGPDLVEVLPPPVAGGEPLVVQPFGAANQMAQALELVLPTDLNDQLARIDGEAVVDDRGGHRGSVPSDQ